MVRRDASSGAGRTEANSIRRVIAYLIALLASMRFASADPRLDAEQLYRDGQAAYDQAHYDEAIGAWKRSHELSAAPGLLFNIAQAYRLRSREGDCTEARANYQAFIQLADPSPQRSLAEGYVADLASCAKVARVASDNTVAPPRSMRDRELAVAAVGVGGIALFATGVYFGRRASTLGDEVTRACASSCDWSSETNRDQAGHRDSTLAWTFGALGTAVIIGDAALYWFGIHEAEVRVAPIATRPGEAGALLSWSKPW
jgi:tetratricopeptide (TPR) repeat protein